MNLAEYLSAHAITQQELAEKIGVTQSRVSQWLAGETIPAERCSKFEEATGGAVTRYDLRPDVFGNSGTVNPARERRTADRRTDFPDRRSTAIEVTEEKRKGVDRRVA